MSPKTNLVELFRKQFSTYPQGTSSKTQKNTGATSTFLCQSSQATTTAAAWVPRGVDTGAGTSRWQVDQKSLVTPVLWKCENQPVTRYRMPGSRILCFKIMCIWHMGSGFSFLYERQDTNGASNLSFAQSKPSTFYGTNIAAHSQWLPATASPRVSPLGVLFKKMCSSIDGNPNLSAKYQIKNLAPSFAVSVRPSHHSSCRSCKGRRHRSRNLQVTRCQNSLVTLVLWKCGN